MQRRLALNKSLGTPHNSAFEALVRLHALPLVNVIRLLDLHPKAGRNLTRLAQHIERSLGRHFSSGAICRLLDFEPMRRFGYVGEKYLCFGVPVRFAVQREKQLGRKLPKSMPAEIIAW